MPEHTCRWNLTPSLDQCGRVAPGHDVRSSDKWGTNRDFAGALRVRHIPQLTRLLFPYMPYSSIFAVWLGWLGGRWVFRAHAWPDERFLPALDEWPLLLCARQEMKVVPPDGTLERLEDGCCVVTGPLDEEGLAVASASRTPPRAWPAAST